MADTAEPRSGEVVIQPWISPKDRITLNNLIERSSVHDTLHHHVVTANRTCDSKACGGALMDPRCGAPYKGSFDQKILEAEDFYRQYYRSLNRENSAEHLGRLAHVEACMKETGTYEHTLEELEFATRTAWRNAPRCIGRIQWKNLKTFDARHVQTAAEMFECIKEHLSYATNGGNLRSAITIFPPKRNGKEFRVWNPQFIQYAGYKKGNTIIGDPANIELTQLLNSLGWKGKRTRFDILPLLLQANSEDPEWFELPPELCLEVQLRHPDYPWFKDLGLKWFAVPAVANMRLEVGGLEYIGAPFNGWYMGTEVGARDLCDEQRYNMLSTIGQMMGLDIERPSSLWKDRAIVEANVAVIHSFQTDRVTITDHHTASESFMQHMAMEQTVRGGCPADWVWIVPPLSGSACPVFHQEMVKYSLKPSYEYQAKPWTNDRFGRPCLPSKVEQDNNKKIKLTFEKLVWCIMALLSLKKGKLQVTSTRPRITILYATETGRSLVFSRQVAKTLQRNNCAPKIVCMDDYNVNKLEEEEAILVIASTFGSGEPPENGRKFWRSIDDLKEPLNLENLVYSVLGLGSSLYQDFCKFGKDMNRFLSENGAYPICPIHQADEMKGQGSVLKEWSKTIVEFFTEEIVEEEVVVYRCNFVKNGEATSSQKILSNLHNTDTKLVEVKQVEELQAKGTTPKYFDVQFSGEHNEENVDFEPGDHLQIHPSNRMTDIKMVLSKLRVAPEQYDELLTLEVYNSETETWNPDERFKDPLTLDQALHWFLDLMAPASEEFIEAINEMDGLRRNSVLSARRNSAAILNREHLSIISKPTSSFVEEGGEVNGTEEAKDKMPLSFLDVIQRVKPQSISPEVLLRYVTTIKPRKYSISTAPLYENKPLYDVTFKEIVYSRNGVQLKGLATGFMSDLDVGHRTYVSFSRAYNFRLAIAGPKPSLMIAQGTGISPFRSFWRHKLALHQNPHTSNDETGELHLYYGCRNQDIDFLYKREILDMKERGILKDVKMAYSRDKSMPKSYVQHLLTQNADKVGKLMYEDRGYIFYCGDISNWDEICNLLCQVLQTTAALTEEQAKHYLKQMMQENRLLRDIFMD